jgi:hypothetical protein
MRTGVVRHLEKCSHCQRVHARYQNSQQSLAGLKQITPPQHLWNGYWEGIQSKMASSPQEPSPGTGKIVLDFFSRKVVPTFSMAALVVLFLFFSYQEVFFPSSGTTEGTTLPSTITPGIKPPKTHRIKESSHSPVPLSSPEVEYELYKVIPAVKETTSTM